MLIKVYVGGLYAKTPFYTNANDGFSKLLSRSGFDIVENANEADIFISTDIHRNDLNLFLDKRISHSTFLLRNEPKIVWPLNYKKAVTKKYGTVIDIGRINTSSDFSFNWPQFWPDELPKTPGIRLDEIAIIAGNKVSLVPGELYSLRRKCILEIDNIAHFGTSWDSSALKRTKELVYALRTSFRFRILPKSDSTKYWFKKYNNWLGSPVEKRICLSAYKYSLVIENSADYLSEKLFDAFFSLTIPIYVGPNVADFGIPADLVIQCEQSVEAINAGIQKAYGMDYESWCIEVTEWLGQSQTRENWDGYIIYGRIIEEIKRRAQLI